MNVVKAIDWTSETQFFIGGIEFGCDLGSYREKTTPDRIIVLKRGRMLRDYIELFQPYKIDNVLELGIWQGGSPLFFGLATDAKKIVGLDQILPFPYPLDAPPPVDPLLELFHRNPAIDTIIARHGLAERVKLHFGISQDDRRAVEEIMAAEFGEQPLDLVIDDASHQYETTRRSFEIIFPKLREGGLYIIEDWQWAHLDEAQYQDGSTWGDQPALSNFIFDLLMAYGSQPGLFSNMLVRHWFVAIQKGGLPLAGAFRLDDLIRSRGNSLWLI